MAMIKCPECGKDISDQAKFCPNCGYPIEKIIHTKPYRQPVKHRNSPVSIFILVLCSVLIIGGSIFLISVRKNTTTSTDQNTDVITPSPEIVPEENNTASLDDFDYSFGDDGSLLLEEYNGDASHLKIESSYEIDGVTYSTANLNEFQIGIGNSTVNTVIFSEGITNINNSVFNSCNVTTIYFPKSLEIIYDDTLAYLTASHIDIYYGGSEDEWNSIFTEYTPSSVSQEFKDGNAREAGKAMADKINSVIGHEYDASKITIHYEYNADAITW